MPIDRVVINASPLITLFRAGLQPLLPKLFPELLVPDSVWNEVVSQAHDDPAARGLPIAGCPGSGDRPPLRADSERGAPITKCTEPQKGAESTATTMFQEPTTDRTADLGRVPLSASRRSGFSPTERCRDGSESRSG